MPLPRLSLRPLAVATLSAALASACAPSPAAPHGQAPVYSYKVVARHPHDPQAFTQGLIWKDGHLYESTGLTGRSTVRKVDLVSGRVLLRKDLPADVFGEGLTDRGEQLLVLSWTNGAGYVLDRADLSFVDAFAYPGEGWGLTHSADTVYMSDGTAQIRLLDPATLRERSRIEVTDNGRAIDRLNELEWVEGEIYANIWQTDRIARIDPKTGKVRAWIDLSGLLREHGSGGRGADVLNGIAYDASGDRLFVTGKLWPDLFQIELVPPAKAAAKR